MVSLLAWLTHVQRSLAHLLPINVQVLHACELVWGGSSCCTFCLLLLAHIMYSVQLWGWPHAGMPPRLHWALPVSR